MKNQYHSIQEKILIDLLFAQELQFSELKPKAMPGSQLMFHVEQLKKEQLIEKNTKGSYELTAKGKEIASRAQSSSQKFVIQAKILAMICCERIHAQKKELLCIRRKKNPFYDCLSFPTEKVVIGETIEQAAVRGLHEETNLIGHGKLKAIRHYHVFQEGTGEFLEDKCTYIYHVTETEGTLCEYNNEGEFFWMSPEEILSFSGKKVGEMDEVVRLLHQKSIPFFEEKKYFTSFF